MADLAVAFLAAEEIDAIEIPFLLQILDGKRQRRDIPKVKAPFVKDVAFHYTPSVFRTHFRLSPGIVEELMMELQTHYSSQAGTWWPLQEALLACLWTLGNLEPYESVAERFSTSRSDLSSHIHAVCCVIASRCQQHITWPRQADAQRIERAFCRAGFPHTLAVVDACHVRIVKPQEEDCPEEYFNCKEFYSLNLTAFTDPSGRFLHINVDHPGSWPDARVFRQTDVARVLERTPQLLLPDGMHLIGDSAYPLSQHLMTPFGARILTAPQKRYNRQLLAAAAAAGHAFGLLKSRFRRLNSLHMQPVRSSRAAVTACCVMHNMSLEAGEEPMEPGLQPMRDQIHQEAEESLPPNHPAVCKRHAICASL
ncbi:hypothetical protein JZ751_015461 [Albula glossodonta]|uniref:DDE Tnp4 domain-containing protein n=1 Tax=Albula glossodonta TaxID=121402 RepID=A0A8T2N3J8_9TELE|nr:hypothetical protein JZ751_015461 [Albula glossodonta]